VDTEILPAIPDDIAILYIIEEFFDTIIAVIIFF